MLPKDFTLKRYGMYLQRIQKHDYSFFTFRDYFKADLPPARFCMIRHDVDRKPENALKMAQLENKLGLQSTFYFRTKPHTFKPIIIQEIHSLGHEIGYHYECLSDTRGNQKKAHADFEKNLKRLRNIVPIDTISMHGRPLLKYDNRDMWRHEAARTELRENHEILGEIYLHLDYSDVAYINDTGRNWFQTRSNRRDKVDSNQSLDFYSGSEMLTFLTNTPPDKLIFQIHPERWTDNNAEYNIQLIRDQLINLVKKLA